MTQQKHKQHWDIDEGDGTIYEHTDGYINPLFLPHHDCSFDKFEDWLSKAKLAISAPDLLSELQELRDWVEHAHKSKGFSRESLYLGAEQSIKRADALIAKAKGDA